MTTKLNTTKGDAVDILGEITQDITGWFIRAELWDATKPTPLQVRKATVNVTGGADIQIKITDATNGKFTVFIDSGDTTSFIGDAQMEIEMEDTVGKKYTVFRGFVNLEAERITWDAITDP